MQKDTSAYWTPALYYQHPDGTFESVPNDGMTVYYVGMFSHNFVDSVEVANFQSVQRVNVKYCLGYTPKYGTLREQVDTF